jgi:hypothetical protein
VTEPVSRGPRDGNPLPPDPEQYDEPRNVAARRRGLDQPYIAGGQDPDLPETLTRERPYVRILLLMVIVIVALGFILGIVANVITPAS